MLGWICLEDFQVLGRRLERTNQNDWNQTPNSAWRLGKLPGIGKDEGKEKPLLILALYWESEIQWQRSHWTAPRYVKHR